MLHKYRTLMLGAMLGFGTLAYTVAGASASAMLPLSSVVSGEANAPSDGIIRINHKNKWHRRYSGSYCNGWYGGCNNFYRYRYHAPYYRYRAPYLAFPLVLGGGYGAYSYYDDDYGYAGGSSRHVRWCLNRYRSYNPRTNLWVAYSGRRHQCNSPYY